MMRGGEGAGLRLRYMPSTSGNYCLSQRVVCSGRMAADGRTLKLMAQLSGFSTSEEGV
jgi:hypothetical protein